MAECFYIIVTVIPTSWLVRSSPDWAARVQALAGEIVLCSSVGKTLLIRYWRIYYCGWLLLLLSLLLLLLLFLLLLLLMLWVNLRWISISSREE